MIYNQTTNLKKKKNKKPNKKKDQNFQQKKKTSFKNNLCKTVPKKREKKTGVMSKSSASRFSSNSWSIQLCRFPVFGRKNQTNATLS
jgi:hypothetical protein